MGLIDFWSHHRGAIVRILQILPIASFFGILYIITFTDIKTTLFQKQPNPRINAQSRDNEINELQSKMTEKDGEVLKANKKIQELDNILRSPDAMIKELQARLAKRDNDTSELQKRLAFKDDEIFSLRNETKNRVASRREALVTAWPWAQTHRPQWNPNIGDDINSFGPLDGCYYVYLDVGSNVGVQVRKLFEPHLYPNATFLDVFNKEFGPVEERKKHVCAVGFEPNPHHTNKLSDIEKSYHKCGWKTWFFKETGVSNRSGQATFYSDGADAYNEWGGGILSPKVNSISLESKKSNKTIHLLRLSQFLLDVVGKRKLPSKGSSSRRPPTVVMKMDIEGSEIDVLPDILFNGGLGVINALVIEFHERLEKIPTRKAAHNQLQEILHKLNDFTESIKDDHYNFKIINVDDESYGNSNERLPHC